MKKIIFFSSSPIPSYFASSINVINMSNSFSKYFDVVEIYHRIGENTHKYNFYKILNKVKFNLYSYSTSRFRNLIDSIKTSMLMYVDSKTLIYGRNITALSILVLRKKKVIIEIHEPLEEMHFINKIFLSLIKKSVKNLGVVFITKPIQYSFKNFFKCKNIVLSDAANDNFMYFNNKLIKNVGYVGSFNKGRGLELILKLSNVFPELTFHIFGGNKNQLKSLINKNINSNIQVHGKIYPKDIHKIFKLFQIAIAPYENKVSVKNNSDTSKFMSPLKIFEYMASNKVVLASNHDVLKEVLVDKKNAFLIDYTNIDKWISTINYIINNTDNAKLIALNGYNDFKKKYSWDLRVKKIIYNFDYLNR